MRFKILIFFLTYTSLICAKDDAFINPITDVCWECLFPITVSGINVTPGYKDFVNYKQPICVCAGLPPRIGVPISFWEPTRLVDVTRHAYKLVGMGGISVGNENIKNRGSVGILDESSSQHSFYHVHWYGYPIISLLELFTDFACVEKSPLDMIYMSEFDPLWNDDQLSFILDPEAALFSNPLAQLACIADCTASTFSVPNDDLFWCAGCQGSLYPLTGSISHHVGTLQASSLLVHRLIAKLHRCGIVKGYGNKEFCEPHLMPIIKKSLYKTQLIHPIPQTKGPCHPLGKSDLTWGSNKTFPGVGEELVYLIWVKKLCCLDAVKPIATGGIQ